MESQCSLTTTVGVVKRMVEAHQGKHKDLVKFMAGQTCLKPNTIRNLLRTIDLQAKIPVNGQSTGGPTCLISDNLQAHNE